jgi:hypothetical protein
VRVSHKMESLASEQATSAAEHQEKGDEIVIASWVRTDHELKRNKDALVTDAYRWISRILGHRKMVFLELEN